LTKLVTQLQIFYSLRFTSQFGDAEFSLVEPMLISQLTKEDERQVKFLNHLCKTLVQQL
jgi:hypothetical protein